MGIVTATTNMCNCRDLIRMGRGRRFGVNKPYGGLPSNSTGCNIWLSRSCIEVKSCITKSAISSALVGREAQHSIEIS